MHTRHGWNNLANPALQRLRQENLEFEHYLGHTVRSYLKTKQNDCGTRYGTQNHHGVDSRMNGEVKEKISQKI